MPQGTQPLFFEPYWWPALATLLLALGLVGWGSLLSLVTTGRRRDLGLGMLGALGMALSIALGGILNLAGVISLPLARGFVAVGVAAAIGVAARSLAPGARASRPSSTAIVGIALTLALVFVAVAAGVAQAFNPHDDFHGYLNFPLKMLETGSIGNDPFNERRMLEYGGQSFLYVLALALVELRDVHILEYGVAAVLLVALLAGYVRRRGLPVWWAVGLVAFYFLTPIPIENLTSVTTGLVLFLALLMALAESADEPALSRLVTLILLASAAAALKNSHIPGLGLILLAAYLGADRRPFGTRAREIVWLGVGILLCLVPWMFSMWRSSGTFLYPLLGAGYSGSVYGRFIPVACGTWTISEIVQELRVLVSMPDIVGGGLLALMAAVTNRSLGTRMAAWCTLGAAVAALAVDVANGGMGPRYAWSFTYACLLFTTLESAAAWGATSPLAGGRWRWLPVSGAVVVATLGILHVTIDDVHPSLASAGYRAITTANTLRTDVERNALRIRGVQTFVPAGEPILARLSRPFQLNFARNPVYIVDWPGGASLPPGIPIEQTAEDVARYLVANGLRYVMYSYADEAGYSVAGFRHRVQPGTGYMARARVTTELTFEFQRRLVELAGRYTRLVDDGRVFVLDLLRPL